MENVEIDLRTELDDEGERWLTVSEAAAVVGVSGAAIRGWYRSGRIATQRAGGDRGPFLVPLSAILRLGVEADDDVIDLDAPAWSDEVADLRRQVEFLREQLAESAACERAAAARAEAAEAELERLRAVSAATSSITDPSWLDLSTNRYEGPVRRQEPRRAVEVAPDVVLDLDEAVEAGAVAATPVPRRAPGDHADDLLPPSARRLGRGRR